MQDTAAILKEIELSEAYYRGYNAAQAHARKMRELERERKAERRETLKYFIKQKAAGLLLIALGIISVPACDYDGTAALFMIPLGALLLFTKQRVLDI